MVLITVNLSLYIWGETLPTSNLRSICFAFSYHLLAWNTIGLVMAFNAIIYLTSMFKRPDAPPNNKYIAQTENIPINSINAETALMKSINTETIPMKTIITKTTFQ